MKQPAKSTLLIQPYLWPLLILLVAAALRLWALADAPPGLTHDEADHGLDAWAVVNGARPIYFTVGFGREPLFDYSTALLMRFLGPTWLAGRLTAVFFSLILVAGVYAWTRRAFDRRVALLTAAGLAVSFWGVMTGRQALRSITLPALFVMSVLFYWRAAHPNPIANNKHPIAPYLLSSLLLGLTFYTYIPARVLWLLFPALLLHAAVYNRPLLARAWRGTAVTLLIALLIAAPLLYIVTATDAETRVAQLNTPLISAAAGDFQPLLTNAAAGLRLLTIEGDSAWRYNLPGRPFLGPVMGVLFYAGLVLALWRAFHPGRRSAAHFFAVAWLIIGLSPSLVTGAELSTTQAIGMQPVLTLFPALALDALAGRLRLDETAVRRRLAAVAVALLFAAVAVVTTRDYFIRWANLPEVRLQYETTLISTLRYLDRAPGQTAAISTPKPRHFHSPAVAALHAPEADLGWFDGRSSLLLPGGVSAVALTGAAPLAPELQPYFTTAVPIDTLPMRPDDIDRPAQIYLLNGRVLFDDLRARFSQTPGLPATFGETAVLVGYDLQTPRPRSGDTLILATLWQIQRATADELVLFTHLLDGRGEIVTQADRLDIPSDLWRAGDAFVQLHRLDLPPDSPPGEYGLAIGLYRPSDGTRLPVAGSDHVLLPPVTVAP